MKNITRILAVAIVLMCSANVASAQKFGILNSQELIMLMPELDSVQIKLQAYNVDVSAQIEAMSVELNQRVEDYQAKVSTMTEAVKQLKEKEFNDLQSRLTNYQAMAREEYNTLQQTLLTPVRERARAAIDKVAKAGSYVIVFDEAAESTLYTDKVQVVNLMAAVKKELGIPENAKPKQ